VYSKQQLVEGDCDISARRNAKRLRLLQQLATLRDAPGVRQRSSNMLRCQQTASVEGG
jgi:hypothetical protein